MIKKKYSIKKINDFAGKAVMKTILPLAQQFLPKIMGELHKIQQLVEDGGMRQAGDDAIVVLVTTQGDTALLNIHPVRWSEEAGGMVLQKAIRSHDITQIIASGFDFQSIPNIDQSKEEEE